MTVITQPDIEFLYREHSLGLVRFALLLTGDRASAEDIAGRRPAARLGAGYRPLPNRSRDRESHANPGALDGLLADLLVDVRVPSRTGPRSAPCAVTGNDVRHGTA
jgi:hypothetical protein